MGGVCPGVVGKRLSFYCFGEGRSEDFLVASVSCSHASNRLKDIPGNANSDRTPVDKPPCCGRLEDTCCREDCVFWQTRGPRQRDHAREEWHPRACLCESYSPPRYKGYSTRMSSRLSPDAALGGCSTLLLVVSGLVRSVYQVTYPSLWSAFQYLNCSKSKR